MLYTCICTKIELPGWKILQYLSKNQAIGAKETVEMAWRYAMMTRWFIPPSNTFLSMILTIAKAKSIAIIAMKGVHSPPPLLIPPSAISVDQQGASLSLWMWHSFDALRTRQSLPLETDKYEEVSNKYKHKGTNKRWDSPYHIKPISAPK